MAEFTLKGKKCKRSPRSGREACEATIVSEPFLIDGDCYVLITTKSIFEIADVDYLTLLEEI